MAKTKNASVGLIALRNTSKLEWRKVNTLQYYDVYSVIRKFSDPLFSRVLVAQRLMWAEVDTGTCNYDLQEY